VTGMLLLLMTACQPSDKQQEEQAREKVMALHDSAMALMSPVNAYSEIMDSLLGDTTGQYNPVRAARVSQLLERAGQIMWDWMHQFRDPTPGTPHDTVIGYYHDQQVHIESVYHEMLNALDSAKSFLNQKERSK